MFLPLSCNHNNWFLSTSLCWVRLLYGATNYWEKMGSAMYNCDVYIVDWRAQTNTILLSTLSHSKPVWSCWHYTCDLNRLHIWFNPHMEMIIGSLCQMMSGLRWGLYWVSVDLGQVMAAWSKLLTQGMLCCSAHHECARCMLYAFFLTYLAICVFYAESNVITTVLQAPFHCAAVACQCF